MHVHARTRVLSLATTVAVVAAGLLFFAQPAVADTAPPLPNTPETVSSDGLPTVQIDGVVWDQEVVGNTAYAGGEFQTARPAGAAPGVNTVTRKGLLSYNLQTGVLNNSWAPNPNARIRNMTLSPDGSRLYVAGSFTSIAGSTRYRIAAFDTATGALTSFRPVLNGKVNAVAATNDTVYLVGQFTTANGAAVSGAAAYDAVTGVRKAGWAPTVSNGQATSAVVKTDGTKVVIGGYFQSVNGSSNPGYGLAMLDGTTGANLPFNVNATVRNADANAAIASLSSDEGGVYGTGQHYGSGTLEGTFYASWDDGNITWVEDCHGDTYSVFPTEDVIYTTGHAHYCGNIGAFPQPDPWVFHRALAFTKSVEGTITNDPYGYTNWAGTPRPALLDWYPDINIGSFTGVSQGGWSVAGNSQYILYGGEFTRVNNVPQQGIVRFASKAIAPNKDAPRLSGTNYVPSVVSLAAGTARIAWPANWDRDNANLKYDVIRNGVTGSPVFTTTANSNFWQRPTMHFLDSGLTPGATYTYRIRVSDPFGNVINGNNVSVVVSSTGTISSYAEDVLDDSPVDYWRLGEPSGPSVYDWSGFQDGVANAGVGFGAAGAIGADSNTAATFNGSNGLVATQSPIQGPDVFALEAWIKTTSTSGGKIIGFGNANTGNSTNYDRHLYMDGSGRVLFGVYPGSMRTVQSAPGLNNGQWHHVVGNLGPSGMQLYVDGVRVAQRSDTTFGQSYSGYWRIGGDSTWAGNNYFNGAIDDVAVYGAPLSIQQVNSHYASSGRTAPLPPVPTDSYGARVYNDSPDLYWRLGESGGSVAADSGVSGNTGNYSGGVTKGVAGALAGVTNTAAAFNGSNGLVASSAQFSNPTVYSLELWFNSTTGSGGKLIGFGSSATGTSGSYDRHVYLQDDGKLVFGVWTGQTNTITTPGSYTDGLWHQVVATQSGDGMKLFVDGQLAGTNPQTQSQAYDGYWRVGGDTTWGSSSAYVNARIDEAAVYSTALSADTVAAHYSLGSGVTPNVAPTASFEATPGLLTVDVDGGGSADSDGTIASYEWNFGDSTTGSGVTATHTYATAGTYTVSLTVTDDGGATAVTSKAVTIQAPPPNVPPTAAFTTAITNLDIETDAATSTDSDGTIASYAWDFGDDTTATGVSATHSYAAEGTYTVTLTVTDDDGGIGISTQSVTVSAEPPPNLPPTAAFTATTDFLSADFDATGTTDPDGTIVGYEWDFGDTQTSTTGPTVNHGYSSAGTYTVSLTVTDDDGAENTTTQTVVVTAPPANTPPTASFTSTVAAAHVDVDGTGSSDPDGTLASYAWDFGDGGTASESTAAHDYAAAGTYTITLTVTDNVGATGTSSSTVTIEAPPGPTVYATDAFGRSVSNGFGTADVGGAWTVTGGASNFSVGSGTATMNAGAGGTATAYLTGFESTSTDVQVQLALTKTPTATGTYVTVSGRAVGSKTLGGKLRFYPSGAVTLQASNGTAIVLPGLSYTLGEQLQVRVQVTGTSPTTIRAKAWRVGEQEPVAWQVTGTDSAAVTQAAGGTALQFYLPGSVTNAPAGVTFDNYWAVAPE
ncbi:PKD domain-containing protein [Glaciibacter superstes]|uniref:PKD domain-containing protein n=1 Tax=Glaciibacter superstes TaxID=501023 RepID=UPI0003B48462|nr:PKD domain-containing protein [Glaciibacter superstes]